VAASATQLRGSLATRTFTHRDVLGGSLLAAVMTGTFVEAWRIRAHCAALRDAGAFRKAGPEGPSADLERTTSPDVIRTGRPGQARRVGGVNLVNSIASASIVSASCKGHPVDALALEADEGRCRLR
jgi:hypothetical protein